MTAGEPRAVQIVHALPGRLRLRCSWLRKDRTDARALAERLADRDGIVEVRARPYTESLLVRFDPAVLDEGQVVEAVRQLGGATHVLAKGEPMPVPDDTPPLSHIATQAAKLFRELDRDLRRATHGTSDLGTLVTLAMFAAGTVEAFRSKQLPLPPWFNLAWWGFNTFTTLEKEEIDHAFDAEEVS